MAENKAKKILLSIKTEIGAPCQMLDDIQNESVLEIQKDHLREIVEFLLHNHQPIHLTTITADSMESDPNQIHIFYNFWKGEGFTLLTKLNQNDLELNSILDLIPGVDFYEREVAEMYGIHFANRENTPSLLLPDDWDQKPPMRSQVKE